MVGVRQLPVAPSEDALLLEADEPSVADDHVVQEVDAEELASLSFTASTEPYDVVVAPDGGHLYVAMKNGGSENGDGTVVSVELPSGDILAEEILDASASPEGIVVTPDGNKVYVGARGDMYIVDVSDPSNPNFTGTTGVAERELVVSPDGAWVYADDNVVRTSDDTAFAVSEFSGERGVAISPDGLTLFSTDEDSSVKVVDVTPGNPPDTAFNQDITDGTLFDSYGIDLTDEGDRGVVSFRSSDAVRIFDTATLSFTGSPILMEFGEGEGTIFGSEPKQLVITHTIQPEPTPTPTPVPSLTPTAVPIQLPPTGGTPASSGGVSWLALLVAGVALAGAGGALAAVRRRR